jgi:hypothetical protein
MDTVKVSISLALTSNEGQNGRGHTSVIAFPALRRSKLATIPSNAFSSLLPAVIDDALGKALFVIFSKAALSCWEFDVLSGVGASDRMRFWA